ncbi:MAG: hypothetical protein COA43_11595 [Robiginitomaculum sp.]|nr:MAG: hypothetical protein COA43_11595 [Robiginitomaculum sp.]
MKSLKELGIGICLGGSLALTGCGQETVAPSLVELNCPEIQGAEALLTREGVDLIVFGEIHGAKEPPQFVADMICASLKTGQSTVLALEYPYGQQGDLDEYLNNADETLAARILLSKKFWTREWQDGRTSQAMFDLIKQIKSYYVLGYDVRLHAYQPWDISTTEGYDKLSRSEQGQAYEKKMAKNLWSAVGDNKVIALVGNLHAKRGAYPYESKSYDLMAKHLPIDAVVTVNVQHFGGTAWNCRGETPNMCKVYKSGASRGKDKKSSQIFRKNGEPIRLKAVHMHFENENGYDGVYNIVTFTSSSPAHTLITD